MDLSTALVLDNGGSSLRAGFAGQEAPLFDVPNTTARIKRQMRLLVADETEEKIKGELWDSAAVGDGCSSERRAPH